MFGIAPPSSGTRRRAESVLETPRGRELFNEFLEQLARQPAPSEEPTQSGTTIDAPVGITATTVPRLRQGVAFSMDPSRPSLQSVGNARGDVPMVTTAYATSDRRTQSGEGVPASGLSHQGSGQAQGLVQSGVERPGAAGATTRANDSAGGRGTLPVQSTVAPTVGTGTSTVNPALQAFLVDTLSQALQKFSVKSEAPTLRAQATAPVSRHMATSTEYTRAGPDRLMRSPMAGPLDSVSPRVTLPTPASTLVGMSMAAIPSYGGVSIQVPSANRDEVENGALRPGAFYPPFQPPMTTTSGWNSTGTLPAWSAAPATATPVKYGNWRERYQTSTGLPHGPETNQFNSQEGWYGTSASGGYSRQNVPIIAEGPHWVNVSGHCQSTRAEVLERTRDVSSGALGTPEYWLNCSVLASEGEHVSSEGSTEDAVERDFVRNVCIGLDGTAVSNSKSPEEVVGTLPFRWRSIIRIQDYELLKQGLNAKESRLPEDPEGLERVGAEGIPPLREKVEEGSLDEESLSDYFVEVGETLSEAF
ncbi:hypothetical protein Pcac1_g8921 [Phytophthora cactorum]|nr:hypothetical protein Pcac1_g8921 [Phytophthora cactorum]